MRKKLGIITLFVVLFCGTTGLCQRGVVVDGAPLRIYNCVLNSKSLTIEPGTRFEMFINFENNTDVVMTSAEVMIEVPEGVTIITNEGVKVIDEIAPHNTYGISYIMVISQLCEKYLLPIDVWISNGQGHMVKCYTIPVRMGQQANTAMKPVQATDTPKTTDGTAKSKQETSAVTDKTVQPDATEKKIQEDRSKVSKYVVKGANRLNIRQKASTDSPIVGRVVQGDVLEVAGVSNGWATVIYDGTVCYVSEKYLQKIADNHVSTNEEPINKSVRESQEQLNGESVAAYSPAQRMENQDRPTQTQPRRKSDGIEAAYSTECGLWFGDVDRLQLGFNLGLGWRFIFMTAGVAYHGEFMYKGYAGFIRIPVATTIALVPKNDEGVRTVGVLFKGGLAIDCLNTLKYNDSYVDISGSDRTSLSGFVRATLYVFGAGLFFEYDFPLAGVGVGSCMFGLSAGL